ncbi:MAG: glycosyltransferase, partial [Candidatus Tectomicrobia bacterium]
RFHIGDNPLVMYTGILDRLQRVDYLLKAMQTVVEKRDDARLLMVTNIAKEQDLRHCQETIEELGLEEHVAIVTHDTFEELPLFLAAADVTVVCRPHCPGFPLKLLNYMAASKPIVAFEGSAKGLQHLKHAFVVQDHDWKELGRGITKLLEFPELAETLGQNGRQWVEERFSCSYLAGQIEDVYDDVLEGRP